VERNEMGALYAWVMFATVSGQVEQKRMLLDWFWGEVDASGRTDVAVSRGVVGEGSGEG
jgi:uncharacterized protein affecting Mg2+/Co2+ transport